MLGTAGKKEIDSKKDTYNILDILARKMQVGEFPEVIWEGQVPSPLVEVSRFGNQIYSQVHHGGWSSIPIQCQQSVQQSPVTSSKSVKVKYAYFDLTGIKYTLAGDIMVL